MFRRHGLALTQDNMNVISWNGQGSLTVPKSGHPSIRAGACVQKEA